MSPVRDVSWAKVMQGKGLGRKGWEAARASPSPQQTAWGFFWSRQSLVLLQEGWCCTSSFLCPCYLRQNEVLAGTRELAQHSAYQKGGSLAGLSPYFLGSRTNFVSFDPLLLLLLSHTYLWNRFFLLLPAQHFADISYWPWQNDNAGQQRRQTNLLANKDKFKSNYALPSCHNNKNSSVNSALQIIWNKHKVAKGW